MSWIEDVESDASSIPEEDYIGIQVAVLPYPTQDSEETVIPNRGHRGALIPSIQESKIPLSTSLHQIPLADQDFAVSMIHLTSYAQAQTDAGISMIPLIKEFLTEFSVLNSKFSFKLKKLVDSTRAKKEQLKLKDEMSACSNAWNAALEFVEGFSAVNLHLADDCQEIISSSLEAFREISEAKVKAIASTRASMTAGIDSLHENIIKKRTQCERMLSSMLSQEKLMSETKEDLSATKRFGTRKVTPEAMRKILDKAHDACEEYNEAIQTSNEYLRKYRFVVAVSPDTVL